MANHLVNGLDGQRLTTASAFRPERLSRRSMSYLRASQPPRTVADGQIFGRAPWKLRSLLLRTSRESNFYNCRDTRPRYSTVWSRVTACPLTLRHLSPAPTAISSFGSTTTDRPRLHPLCTSPPKTLPDDPASATREGSSHRRRQSGIVARALTQKS